jgi:hypothetical protein
MKQNNCKSENVRAGDAEGKLAAASPAVPLHYPQGGIHSLIPFDH